jgi:hypothetical protein
MRLIWRAIGRILCISPTYNLDVINYFRIRQQFLYLFILFNKITNLFYFNSYKHNAFSRLIFFDF